MTLSKDHTLLNSYRPVVLTSAISKFMEHIVYNRLLYYVQDKIHGSQYGYRKTRSTEDALFRFVDESTRALATKVVDKLPKGDRYYKPLRCLAILYDLTAAFDRVDHAILLHKLMRMKVPAYLIQWIKSFLTNRVHQVRFNK